MDCQNIEVRIQDTNPVNERIFENGWMCAQHSHGDRDYPYFAPYFIEECDNPGITRISRVIHISHYTIADLINNGIKLPCAPSQQHRDKWRLGLSAIRARANIEMWKPEDRGKLFYLDRPTSFRTPALTKEMYNGTNPPKQLGPFMIPPGYTLRYGELLTNHNWALEHPPGCPHS